MSLPDFENETDESESESEDSGIDYRIKIPSTFDIFSEVEKSENKNSFLRDWCEEKYGQYCGKNFRFKSAPSYLTNTESCMLLLGLPFPVLDENLKILKWILPHSNDDSDSVITFKILTEIVAVPRNVMRIFFEKMKFLSNLNDIPQQWVNSRDFFYFRPENPTKIFSFQSLYPRGYITTTYTVEDINGEDVVLNCPADFNRLILVKVEKN